MELRVPIDELRKCRLFVSAPMFAGQCAGMFARSISDLSAICTNHGISLQLYFLFNESLITRARNYCCDEFMRSEATHLMFIDSDIGFNANDVLGLLALSRDQSAGYDIIAGPYPKKCISWEKIKMAVDKGFADKNPNELERFVGDYVFNPKADQTSIRIHEPVEVREAGTGFMMVTRKAMERYRDAFPELAYRPDHVRTEHFDGSRLIHAYFDCIIDRGYTFDDIHPMLVKLAAGEEIAKLQKKAQEFLEIEKTASRRYLSEDYMFCQNAQRVGLKVWFCPWMKLQHVGTYVFGGSLGDLATIGAPATADTDMLRKHRAASADGASSSEKSITNALADPAFVAAEEKRKKKAQKRAGQRTS